MLNPLVDTRDVKFVVFELLEVDKMTKYPAFAEFDHDTFEATIDLAEQMAVEVFYPTAEEGDKVGVKWDPVTKAVKIPEILNRLLTSTMLQDSWGLLIILKMAVWVCLT